MAGTGGSPDARLAGTIAGTRSAPGICKRLTGCVLRSYREGLGLSLADSSAILDCDKSKLSRIETGERGISPKELRELLNEYGVPAETREVLLRLSASRGPWRSFGGLLPDGVLSRMALEACATDVAIFEGQQIPAILQTPEYAYALADADPAYAFNPHTEHGLDVFGERAAYFAGTPDALWDANDLWQSALDMTAVSFTVILSEAALLNQIGPKQTMREQISRIANPPEGVTVQVIPYPLYNHPAPWAGSLAVFKFGERTAIPSIACAGGPTGPLFMEDPVNTEMSTRVITRLRGMALSPDAQEQLLYGLLRG